jgi:hypothetical protein
MSSRTRRCFVREMDAPKSLERLQHLHSQLKHSVARRFRHPHHAKFLNLFIQCIEYFDHSPKSRLKRRPKQRPKPANSNSLSRRPYGLPQPIAAKNFDRYANQNARRPPPLHPRRCTHQSLQARRSPIQINSAHNSEASQNGQVLPSTPQRPRTAAVMREAPSERRARALCRAGQSVHSCQDLGLARISTKEIFTPRRFKENRATNAPRRHASPAR